MTLIAITTRDSQGELRTFYVESEDEKFANDLLTYARMGYGCSELNPFHVLHRREVEIDLWPSETEKREEE